MLEELRRSEQYPSAQIDEINRFARWVQDDVNHPPNAHFTEHFAHVAVIEAAYEAAESGQPVQVRPLFDLLDKDRNSYKEEQLPL